MGCQKDFVPILAFKWLELSLDHTQSVVCIQGVLDPAKVGSLVLRKAVSLSFMVCSRGRLLMRALASVSSMRVWLCIIYARSPRDGGGGSGTSP